MYGRAPSCCARVLGPVAAVRACIRSEPTAHGAISSDACLVLESGRSRVQPTDLLAAADLGDPHPKSDSSCRVACARSSLRFFLRHTTNIKMHISGRLASTTEPPLAIGTVSVIPCRVGTPEPPMQRNQFTVPSPALRPLAGQSSWWPTSNTSPQPAPNLRSPAAFGRGQASLPGGPYAYAWPALAISPHCHLRPHKA